MDRVTQYISYEKSKEYIMQDRTIFPHFIDVITHVRSACQLSNSSAILLNRILFIARVYNVM